MTTTISEDQIMGKVKNFVNFLEHDVQMQDAVLQNQFINKLKSVDLNGFRLLFCSMIHKYRQATYLDTAIAVAADFNPEIHKSDDRIKKLSRYVEFFSISLLIHQAV